MLKPVILLCNRPGQRRFGHVEQIVFRNELVGGSDSPSD